MDPSGIELEKNRQETEGGVQREKRQTEGEIEILQITESTAKV